MSHVQENIVAFHSKLNEFRENEKHCDVTIHVDGRSFKCHRLALSIAGEYFEKMLYGNFRESKEDNVVLQNVNVIAFGEILRFVYTGDISLNENNIIDVFEASEFFKLDRIQELCIRFIEQNMPMTATTTYELFALACSCEKKSLKNTLSRCIMKHFEDYYDDIRFLELAYEDLNLLVSQHWYLSPRNEFMLLDALVRWVFHEPQTRRKYAKEFIDAIDFQFIPVYCSKSILTRSLSETEIYDDNIGAVSLGTNSVNGGVNYGKPELGLHVFLDSRFARLSKIYSINRCASEWKEYHLSEKHLKAIGVKDYLYCFDDDLTFRAYSSIDDVGFRSLKSPPSVTEYGLLSVHLGTIKNFIYLYHHHISIIRSDSITNLFSGNGIFSRKMFSYNIERDEWFPVPPPDMENVPSIMVASDKVLYFFARGHDCVQMFDGRASSKWQKLITTHQNSDHQYGCFHKGKIYTHGYNQIECFDPVAQKWSELKFTNDIPELSRLVSYENWLWGFGMKENSFVMEVYNTSVGEWNQSPCGNIFTAGSDISDSYFPDDVVIFKP